MLADEARDKAKFEARARNNDNSINRATVEAAAKIIFSADIHGSKREIGRRLRQGPRLRLI